jgi:hypothetical protein
MMEMEETKMRRSITVASALTSALALSGFALAAPGGAGQDSHQRHARTIHLTASGFADQDVDVGPPDLTLGDHFVVTEDLFRQGEKVGEDHAVCTLTRLEPRSGTAERGAVQCVATFVLPEGQITVQGVRTFALDAQAPPNFVLAVTGGTGAYKAARGTVHIVDLNETDSRLTLELIQRSS